MLGLLVLYCTFWECFGFCVLLISHLMKVVFPFNSGTCDNVIVFCIVFLSHLTYIDFLYFLFLVVSFCLLQRIMVEQYILPFIILRCVLGYVLGLVILNFLEMLYPVTCLVLCLMFFFFNACEFRPVTLMYILKI